MGLRLFFQAKVFLKSADQGNDISWVMSVVKRRRNVSGRSRAFLQEERAGELPAEGGAIRHDSIQQQEPHERS